MMNFYFKKVQHESGSPYLVDHPWIAMVYDEDGNEIAAVSFCNTKRDAKAQLKAKLEDMVAAGIEAAEALEALKGVR